MGASVGYYATAYLSALRWSYRCESHRRRLPRVLVANLLAFRSVAFYVCAIFSYERFKGLLARRETRVEEVDDESVPTIAAA